MVSLTLIASLKSLSLNIVTVSGRGVRVSTNGFGEGGEIQFSPWQCAKIKKPKFFVFQIKKLKLSFMHFIQQEPRADNNTMGAWCPHPKMKGYSKEVECA